MNDPLVQKIRRLVAVLRATVVIVLLLFLFFVYLLKFYDPNESESMETAQPMTKISEADPSMVVEGIHSPTGLKAGEGLQLVITNCTGCHSAKLITQNRATKEGWENIIAWMQATQNLWELGDNLEPIVSYLAEQYAPEQKGRRLPLQDIEWYELE